jgi:hypothetical protein
MMIDKGCKLLSPSNDVRIISAGVQAVKQAYARHFA